METEHGNNEKRKAAASEAAETKLRFSQSLEHACCTGMTVCEEAGSPFFHFFVVLRMCLLLILF